jgi:hypothetical protein
MTRLLAGIRIEIKRMEGKIEAEIIIIQEKMDATQEKKDAWLQKMRVWLKETMACQEATEAFLEKAKVNPEKMTAGLEEIKYVAEHQETPKEDTAVEIIGVLDDAVIKDRRSNRGDGKVGPGTMLQEKPRKDGRSGRDVGSYRRPLLE